MTKTERLMVEAVDRMLFLHFAIQLFLEDLVRETKLSVDKMKGGARQCRE